MPLHTLLLSRGALYFSVPCLHARAHPKGERMAWRAVAATAAARWLPPGCAAILHVRAHTTTYILLYTSERSFAVSRRRPFFLLFFTTILLFFINRTALDETCSALHVHRITSQWGQNLYVVAIKYLDL